MPSERFVAMGIPVTEKTGNEFSRPSVLGKIPFREQMELVGNGMRSNAIYCWFACVLSNIARRSSFEGIPPRALCELAESDSDKPEKTDDEDESGYETETPAKDAKKRPAARGLPKAVLKKLAKAKGAK
eukprot:6767890-Alexandrium_andersonii.AAC.1